MQLDHINRNVLDNRKSNLRLCTPSENNANRMMRIGKEGFRGVRKQKGRNKWQASIQKNGKKIFIGSFSNKEEAAKAYNDYSLKLFGEFSAVKIEK